MKWLTDFAIYAVSAWYADHGGIIDRGYTEDPDFELGDFTLDGTWYDLDLSEIVPEGAKFVLLSALGIATTNNAYVFYAKPPGIGNANLGTLIIPTAIEFNVVDLWVPLDDDRKISYAGANTTWLACTAIIRAWTF